ncbi:hypothetical protein BT96DRAFT_914772 [Gymnopus androsaceus JB14]|uniref:G-protein coupled receptors family 2 profile 2 domain-containing protein n=1 Tax=Gymnopus androsaceus JB14 TaxID=1447944 RepID=A0A6A4I991_9AGAR|nr:hypothetical protein BT96DRAFT_914772 [Gymnopus androsaceus JB14]
MIGVMITSNSTMCSAIPSGSEETESLRISLIWLFNALQIFGLISIGVVTLTALISSRIKRATTWYIFMGGWILWCISFFLLIGNQTDGCPAFGFCLFQAALIYAGPPANACATLAILLELYFSMKSTLNKMENPRWRTIMLLVAPPAVYVMVFLEALVYGLLNPGSVQRDATGMYCGINSGLPAKVSAALVAIFSITMLVYQVLTFTALYKNWIAFRQLQASPQNNNLSLSMIIRVSVYSFLPIMALGLSLVAAILTTSSSLAHIVTATLPGTAALIFGTQRDILRAIICWRIEIKHVKTYAEKGVSACVDSGTAV